MATIQLNLNADSQTIYYERYGAPKSESSDGAPILLLHGYMQVGRDLLALANNLTAAGYEVIVPDLPGYGRSNPPFRTFPPDFYHRDANLLGQLLGALDLPPVHVMGFSDGGEISLLMPILHPARVRSVIAWGAVGYYTQDINAYVQYTMPRSPIDGPRRARHPGQSLEQWHDQWAAAFNAIVQAGGDVSMSRAAEIKCPLLMMVGEHDTLNPVPIVRQFIEAAVNSPYKTFKLFRGAGHPLHDERPDAFLNESLAFLQQT